MEVVPAGLCRSIARYWRRRKYERLDDSAASRRKSVRLQPGRAVGRRRWRIRLHCRLRIVSPKTLLLRLRDGYVNLMLRLSNSTSLTGGAFGSQAVGFSSPFGAPPLKEYDEKALIDIYKTLIAQGRLVPAH